MVFALASIRSASGWVAGLVLVSQVLHPTFQMLDVGSSIGKMDRHHIHGHKLLDGVAGAAEAVSKTNQFVPAEGFHHEAHLLDILSVLGVGAVELVEPSIELVELGAEVVDLGIEPVELDIEVFELAAKPGIKFVNLGIELVDLGVQDVELVAELVIELVNLLAKPAELAIKLVKLVVDQSNQLLVSSVRVDRHGN